MSFLEPLCTLWPSTQLCYDLISPEGGHSRGCKDQLTHGAGPGPQGAVVPVEEAQSPLECLRA